MSSLSVVIPVHNNERTLSEAYTGIKKSAGGIARLSALQLVFVDDGSTDGSARILGGFGADDPAVCVVTHGQRRGQLLAIESGLRAATGDITIVTSADLQNPVGLIPALFEAVAAGHQLAIAYRDHRADSGLRSIGSRVFYRLMAFLYPQVPAGGFDYGAIDKGVRDYLVQRDFGRMALQLEVFRAAERVAYLPSTRSDRGPDGSGWSLTDRMRYALLFLRYSDLMHKGRLMLLLALPSFLIIVVIWSLWV